MDFSIARRRMVESQIVARGITDQRVLKVMASIPRHLFVEPGLHGHAYADSSLPIGEKQTISQPYIVAAMSAALELKGDERLLEVGTGSGYQTAILASLAKRVYSVERIASLAARRVRFLISCRSVTSISRLVMALSVGKIRRLLTEFWLLPGLPMCHSSILSSWSSVASW